MSAGTAFAASTDRGRLQHANAAARSAPEPPDAVPISGETTSIVNPASRRWTRTPTDGPRPDRGRRRPDGADRDDVPAAAAVGLRADQEDVGQHPRAPRPRPLPRRRARATLAA